MQHKQRGQSLVEMALLLPLLLVVLFGIIDLGYIVYSYATLRQAAREAAEVASVAPPFYTKVQPATDPVDGSDPCVAAIIEATRRYETVLPGIGDTVEIRYPDYRRYRAGDPLPSGANIGDLIPIEARRNLGYPIEVTVRYELTPLTPLWGLLPLIGGGAGDTPTFPFEITTRRTISSLGRDPSQPQLIACEE